MNYNFTNSRLRLLVQRVSNFIFIKLHDPLVNLWKPEEYVRKWLKNHRSATGTWTKVAKANLKQKENPLPKFLYFNISILQNYEIGYLFFKFQILINIGFLYSLDKKLLKSIRF